MSSSTEDWRQLIADTLLVRARLVQLELCPGCRHAIDDHPATVFGCGAGAESAEDEKPCDCQLSQDEIGEVFHHWEVADVRLLDAIRRVTGLAR